MAGKPKVATQTATAAQVQSALGGANPLAMRQAILNRLKIAPGKLAGNTAAPGFDQTINNLYRTAAQNASILNANEGNISAQYDRSNAQARLDNERALQSIKEAFANRGMSFSGANVEEQGKANTAYNTVLQNLQNTRDLGLTGIGRQRMSLIEGLQRGRMSAEQGYGDTISKWLTDQAAKATAEGATSVPGIGGTSGGGLSPAEQQAADMKAWVDATNRNALLAYAAAQNKQGTRTVRRRTSTAPAPALTDQSSRYITGYPGPQ
jgi:hypothetical protein